MSRIIKANFVNIGDEAHVVNVPEVNTFFQSGFDTSVDEQEDEDATSEELLEKAEQRATEIINNAHVAAESIVMETNARLEREKEKIYEEARQKGYADGEKEVQLKGQQIIEDANRTLLDAQEEREMLLRQIEPDVVSLIIDIINKLMGDLVSLNPQVILHIIRTGLDGVPAAKELSIRVSADDYETAEKLTNEITAYVDSDTDFKIIKDTSLNRGDCIIDTPIGSVDCSLNSQCGNLRQDLIQIMKAGR